MLSHLRSCFGSHGLQIFVFWGFVPLSHGKPCFGKELQSVPANPGTHATMPSFPAASSVERRVSKLPAWKRFTGFSLGLTDAHRHSPLDPRIPNSSFRLGTFVGFSQVALISMLSVQIYQYSCVFLFHLRDLLDANPNPKHSLIVRFSTESLKECGKLQSQNDYRPEIMPSTATLGSCGLLSSVSRACTGGDGSHTMPGLTFLQRCRVQHRETKSQPRRTISCLTFFGRLLAFRN